ncbi:UvrD-helicase domain-containing protein [Mesobacillus foraminis]|uniref:RNA polymerase recycling motor HelD n=1 Tax=Mesobacillus foraminis TaxID=279826 RepID=UPI001BEBD266|nr:RNA polymerase recycling motor HelD [Mesobacillus foraminis]MBT2755060.1 UvrD-helicase domain-containing protein [Mesobacillus foraminis]
MSNEKELQMEQNRVDWITSEISKKAQHLEKHAGKIGSEALDIRRTFWEDVTVNFDEPDDLAETYTSIKQQAELLSERERSHSQIDKQLKTLGRLKNSPYFGRIDFTEEGEAASETIYIGISSFMDEKDEDFLIYDWRAPISSLYYDYAPGPAQYETSLEKVTGVMDLKRQFVIREATIKSMFDTGVTIGDEMLQEVLGNNADTQMKSIVATIQKEQNQIIRNEQSKLLIVKGVAGSGKTSAAMQRIAYLLYRYRNIIKSENIMLFSPNPMFNSYVATVLPELGEENMQQATFQEYLHSRIGKRFDLEDIFSQMEYLLAKREDQDYPARIKSIRYKSGLDFKELIDSYAKRLSVEGLIFKDIKFRKRIIFSKEELHDYFYSLDRSYSIPNRIQIMKDWLRKELKRKVKQEQKAEWVEEEIQFLDKDEYLDAFKELQDKKEFTENSFDDFDREKKVLSRMLVTKRFKPVFNAVKGLKFIDLNAIYMQLFLVPPQKPQLLDTWTDISQLTVRVIQEGKLFYEDATPFLYLQDLIEGRKSSTGIRHVFIDEAQDYTPFQFAFIRQLFPYSRMTLLGDLNQAVYSGPTGSETVLAEDALGFQDKETILLSRTYRSTRQIVEFTRQLIQGGDRIEPFNRNGGKPVVSILGNQDSLSIAINKAVKDLKLAGHKTIAVICRTEAESRQAFDSIEPGLDARLIQKGTIAYEKGISIIPAYLAKGIEFDAVIIYDASAYGDEGERKLFYTACTRAMHELYLFASLSPVPLLEGADNSTYILNRE